MVELNAAFSDESASGAPALAAEPPAAVSAPRYSTPRRSEDGGGTLRPPADVAQMFRAAEDQAAQYGDEPAAPVEGRPTEARATESAEAGVLRAGRILGAATTARWPMYLRNVKQILRQADGGFDERRYGFSGLMDLLKACQRDGLLRIERDRRGGLRVFQGASLQRAAPPAAGPGEVIELPEMESIPIDTTAELLGRAKPRKPRARAPRPAPATTPRKAAARKPAARRTRNKKPATVHANDDTEN
ncbi:MAG: hypothetical protein DMF94_12355 [Acidobacteria bacterium]|nr:MAG: hypothetical protein DMF94_12355 [Acidobacteriota bacterium]